MKKVIVAGGRDFGRNEREHPRCKFFETDKRMMAEALHRLLTDFSNEMHGPMADLELVHGGAKGADALAEDWAIVNYVPIKVFKADWDTHGKAGGPIRNSKMAGYADELIAFWDGSSRGTHNMIETMLKMRKPVHVFFYK